MTMNARMPALLLLTLTLAACGGGGTGTPTPVGTPVTSLADSGAGSLRDTLAAAKSGDTLRLTGTGTLTLASPLSIDKNVTIIATGVTIDAAGKGRALDIAKGATVTMQGGTLKGGTGAVLPASLRSAYQRELTGRPSLDGLSRLKTANLNPQAVTVTYGGVLSNAGNLTLDGVTVTGGKASIGGGIYNMEGATLTLKGSTSVTGNEATLADPADYVLVQGIGGGIFSKGTLTVAGGSVSANTAVWDGGGIYAGQGSSTTLSAGKVDGNRATHPLQFLNNVYYGSSGGGIFTQGALNVTGGSVSNNTATFFGAGIVSYLTCLSADCTSVERPTFNMTGGSVNNNVQSNPDKRGSGGGVSTYGTASITGGTLSGNRSEAGGGIAAFHKLTLGAVTLTNNSSTQVGGAVYVGGDVLVNGATTSENSAPYGGGMYVGNDGKLTIQDGLFTKNTASKYGGAIHSIHNIKGFTMTGGIMRGNTAGLAGGGINSDATMSLTGGVIEDNTTPGIGGGIATYAQSGTQPTVTLGGTLVIRNNRADRGGGVSIGSADQGVGTHVIQGATVQGNTAQTAGGGVGVWTGSVLKLVSGSITGNTVVTTGGGIAVGGRVEMTGGSITGNTVTNRIDRQDGSGGGVRLYAGASMTASGGTISNNVAWYGSGVKLDGPYQQSGRSTFVLSGATVSGNRADDNNVAGGFWNDGSLSITAGSVTGNTARVGAGVYNTRIGLYSQTGGSVSGNNPDNVYNVP
ncbi:beta strand repeat-containing protein [Deinococcus knuensis]|uniref:Uncharacterized protein n=1 Tax=Deinococcus knuensis TaxID=1837380 RepID=A0ABQ2SP56_9DEIO|nr:hypothetical protein [Deinococcus knuensis]GGS35979.1 hypothetical protein GCM10008961_29500 [Deinococcus knuensis]